MIVREVGPEQKEQWDEFVSTNPYGHVLQSWDWGEFKKAMGNTPIRVGVFDQDRLVAAASYTLHAVPHTKKIIGYLPKGPVASDKESLHQLLDGLKTSAEKNNVVFIKIEPNIFGSEATQWDRLFQSEQIFKSEKEIFSKHTFYLDLTKSEEELLSNMHEKWRYNIRLAERKGVVVEEKTDHDSLETFIKLQKETARRNKFFIHPDQYYRNLWLTLQPVGIARILVAELEEKVLAAWMIFHFGNVLYYPYGASANEGREVMPTHALMWAATKLGKGLGCTRFDLWGASGPEASKNDPWLGFTRFKRGFGPELVSFLGAYDLVVDQRWYKILVIADKVRWFWLNQIRSRF